MKNQRGENSLSTAKYFCDIVIPAMNELREYIDQIEPLIGKEYWPLPTYGDILFRV